jgi:hypothetical protein
MSNLHDKHKLQMILLTPRHGRAEPSLGCCEDYSFDPSKNRTNIKRLMDLLLKIKDMGFTYI